MSSSEYDVELKIFQTILGEFLSSVEFVQDYVQLRFNGATLTCFTQPLVRIDNRILYWDQPHFKDVLCSPIGHTVKSVSIQSGEYIEVVFDNDIVVQISIRDSDYQCAEAAKFDSVSGDCWVI